jgi:hypothetical protein
MDNGTGLATLDPTAVPSGTVLVVDRDGRSRERWSGWLRDAGLNVVVCPGPTPTSAIPTDCSSCLLIDVADVVVMNLEGPEGGALLFTCPVDGRRLVLLSGSDDPIRPLEEDHIAVLPRETDRAELLVAAWQLMVDGRLTEEEA